MLLADENARWSYEGARALVTWLQELEEDTGSEIEFDVVAIRCEWGEYASALEAALEHGYEVDPEEASEDEDSKEYFALDWLQYNGQAIAFDGGVVVRM